MKFVLSVKFSVQNVYVAVLIMCMLLKYTYL